AQTFDVNRPMATKANRSRPMAIASGAKAEAGNAAAEISKPDAANVFRATLGVAPRAIHASDAHPATAELHAHTRNGSAPHIAMLKSKNRRSITRYNGNQVMRKKYA